MKKVMIVSAMEYGSLIDQVMWCKFLKNKYNVFHLSQSSNEANNYTEGNLTVEKLSKKNMGIIKRKLYLIIKARKIIKEWNPDIVIMDYFPGCSLIKLFKKNKMVMDIRTSTISRNKYKVFVRDKLILIESKIFNQITIISKKIIKKLKLNKNRCEEVPLGATCVVSEDDFYNKSKERLNMLYVGTFYEREIEKTILAVGETIKRRNDINIKYTIIGFSNDKAYEENLKNIIKAKNLEKYIDFVGKVNHKNLRDYYRANNVGLSFIPIKEHFDLQPPTKTYEYIINGLFCLATETTANKDLITDYNGLLINDDINSISRGIEQIYDSLENINYKLISESLKDCTWEKIVDEKLINIIEKLTDKN